MTTILNWESNTDIKKAQLVGKNKTKVHKRYLMANKNTKQLRFTCLKPTTEIVEKYMKNAQS